MRQTFQRELRVRHSQQRTIFADVEFDGVIFVGDIAALKHPWRVSQVKLFRLPGQKAFLNLLGKAFGISCGAESLSSQNRGGLVMAVAIAWSAAEAAGQHVRPENADGAHQIGQSYVMPVPFVKRLFGGLGKAKVDNVAEALL